MMVFVSCIIYICIYEQWSINMTKKRDTKLTSIKLFKHLYNKFKYVTVNTKMSLHKLTNRSIDLYLTDDGFKQQIELHDNLTVSGSNL